MKLTVRKLIEYLNDIKDDSKEVKFGTWNMWTRSKEDIKEFEGMLISGGEVFISLAEEEEEESND